MSLLDQLRTLSAAARSRPIESPALPVRQTAEHLYADIVEAMQNRARAQCATLRFEWLYHYSKDPVEWERLRVIRESVVTRLRTEGIPCWGSPVRFPPPQWDALSHTWDPGIEKHHYINVDWSPSGEEHMRMNEEQAAHMMDEMWDRFWREVERYGRPSWVIGVKE